MDVGKELIDCFRVGMPQCTYRNPNEPYGKGSLNGELLEVTFRTRRRAARINEGENTRFSVYSRLMEKYQAAEDERKSKVSPFHRVFFSVVS